jgi:hypothetical protein
MVSTRAAVTGAKVGALVLGVLAAALGGCQSKPQAVGMPGGNPLTATYSMGTLSTNVVRAGIGPREVASAAEAIFRRRGFTVRQSKITGESARITAQEPGEGEFRATVVTAERISGGVRIGVRVEPFGDHEQSTIMLNDLLARLGM